MVSRKKLFIQMLEEITLQMLQIGATAIGTWVKTCFSLEVFLSSIVFKIKGGSDLFSLVSIILPILGLSENLSMENMI